MSDSNSSADQQQQITNSDDRKVLGQDAIYAETGASVAQNTNYNVSVLDGGAIAASFNSTNNTVDRAFDFGSKALDFGTTALGVVDHTTTQSLAFSNSALQASLQASSDAYAKSIAASNYAVDNAISSANTAMANTKSIASDAISTSQNAMASALSFGAKQTATALDSLNTSATMIDTAYQDAKGRGALTDKILMAAIVGALFVAYQASKR